jgi:hypothetical protein
MFNTTKLSRSSFTSNTNVATSAFNQANTALTNQLYFYTLLARALNTINQLILDFSLGDFSDVAQVLTLDKFNQLSILFSGLQQNSYKYPDYEVIRTNIVKTIQGLMQTVYLYSNLMNTQIKLANAEEKANILTNMTLLNAYLEALQGSTAVFPAASITVEPATIKPQYALYIKMFGYPASGMFDPDKLAECISLTTAVAIASASAP